MGKYFRALCTPEFIQTRILHFLPRLESDQAILVSHIWRLSEVFLGRRPFSSAQINFKGSNLADQPILFEKIS